MNHSNSQLIIRYGEFDIENPPHEGTSDLKISLLLVLNIFTPKWFIFQQLRNWPIYPCPSHLENVVVWTNKFLDEFHNMFVRTGGMVRWLKKSWTETMTGANDTSQKICEKYEIFWNIATKEQKNLKFWLR